MKLRNLMMVIASMAGSVAGAADTSERTSPLDRNAACMDRTVDASSGNCVVKDEGTPRRTYPPKAQAPSVATPAAVPAPASSTLRRSPANK